MNLLTALLVATVVAVVKSLQETVGVQCESVYNEWGLLMGALEDIHN